MIRAWTTCVVAAMLVAAVGCNVTSNDDKFCGRLRSEFQLTPLVDAISSRDQRRVTEQLESLRSLQDVAPAEIHDDFRTLVDTVSDAVRAVTKAPGADGEALPVDLDDLRQRLTNIDAPAQNIARYADKSCGLTINS